MFQAILETVSFTKTGEKLFVSQSAISRQIKLLEEELGDQLFKRIHRRGYLHLAGGMSVCAYLFLPLLKRYTFIHFEKGLGISIIPFLAVAGNRGKNNLAYSRIGGSQGTLPGKMKQILSQS